MPRFRRPAPRSAYVKRYVAELDATVKEPIAYFCSCLVDLFENAGMPQSDLDIYRRKLAGELSDKAIGTLVAKPADYLYQLARSRAQLPRSSELIRRTGALQAGSHIPCESFQALPSFP